MMKSHSNIETIIPTIAIEDIAGELQTSVGKLKKLCKSAGTKLIRFLLSESEEKKILPTL